MNVTCQGNLSVSHFEHACHRFVSPGLDIQSSPFPSGFPTKPSRHFSSSLPLVLPIPFLDFITLIVIVEKYKSWGPSLCCLLQYPVTVSRLGTNIFFSTLFFEQRQPTLFPQMWGTQFHTHTNQGKDIVTYVWNFVVLVGTWDDKRFWTEK